VGYKVHLTETWEDDFPHLITHVETTIGPAANGAATQKIHTALQGGAFCPAPISWIPASWTPTD
jgi:transposase